MIDAMRQTLTASKVTKMQNNEAEALDFREVFYIATFGGAKCMGIDKLVGNFLVGKQFDALVIDMNGIDLFAHDDFINRFQKFVYLADDRNIKGVFVNGKRVI